jgi:molecular chaperone HscA
MRTRALTEAQVDADRIVAATESALRTDGDLLSPDERKAIDDAIAAVNARRDGDDHQALRASAEALNNATTEFAARRMDRSMRAALAGKRVDALT